MSKMMRNDGCCNISFSRRGRADCSMGARQGSRWLRNGWRGGWSITNARRRLTTDTTMGRGRTTPSILRATLSKVTSKTCHPEETPSVYTLWLASRSCARLRCRTCCRFWCWARHFTRSRSIPILGGVSQTFSYCDGFEAFLVHWGEYVISKVVNNLLVNIMFNLKKLVDWWICTRCFLVPNVFWGLDLIRLGVKVPLRIEVEVWTLRWVV